MPTNPFPLTTKEGEEVPKSATVNIFSSVPCCSIEKEENGVVEPIPTLPGLPLATVVSKESIGTFVVEVAKEKALMVLLGSVEVEFF